MSEKAPTISGLQADLRAANAEVLGLIDRQRPIEQENAQLRAHVNALEWQIDIIRTALAMTFNQRQV